MRFPPLENCQVGPIQIKGPIATPENQFNASLSLVPSHLLNQICENEAARVWRKLGIVDDPHLGAVPIFSTEYCMMIIAVESLRGGECHVLSKFPRCIESICSVMRV